MVDKFSGQSIKMDFWFWPKRNIPQCKNFAKIFTTDLKTLENHMNKLWKKDFLWYQKNNKMLKKMKKIN